MKKILREITTYDLAIALIPESSVKVREKVLRNASERAGDLILGDMRCLRKVKKADVIDRQQKILSDVCRLIDSGEMQFPGEALDGSDSRQ